MSYHQVSFSSRRRRGAKQSRQLGQGMTEYIIIVALIAVAAIGVYSLFGKTVRNQVAGVAQEISGQSSSQSLNVARQSARRSGTLARQDVSLGNYDETTESGN